MQLTPHPSSCVHLSLTPPTSSVHHKWMAPNYCDNCVDNDKNDEVMLMQLAVEFRSIISLWNISFAFSYSLFLGHLHITDFGLAKRLKKGQRTNTICGTLQYIGQPDRTV